MSKQYSKRDIPSPTNTEQIDSITEMLDNTHRDIKDCIVMTGDILKMLHDTNKMAKECVIIAKEWRD